MRPRASPANREFKEKVRSKKNEKVWNSQDFWIRKGLNQGKLTTTI